MLLLITALLLSVHLALVDVAMAGPLVCVWLEWRSTRHADALAGQLGRQLARVAVWALAGGIMSGLVLLVVRWRLDPPYATILFALPASRLYFGLLEIGFSLACMMAYVAAWDRWAKWRLVHRALSLAAATNLLVHFPSLFAIVSVLRMRGMIPSESMDRASYQHLLVDAEVLSHVTHVWLAALAVTGVVLMGLAQRLEPSGSARPLIVRAALLALVASVLQIPSGLWMTLQLPDAARDRLVAGDRLASGLFLASVLVALHLIYTLAAVAQGQCDASHVRRSLVAMLLVVLLMSAAYFRVQYHYVGAGAPVQGAGH